MNNSQSTPELVDAVMNGSPSTAVVVGSLVLALACLRVVEAVIAKYLPKPVVASAAAACGFGSTQSRSLQHVEKTMRVERPDGTPAVFSVMDPGIQAQMASDLARVAEAQRATLKSIERLEGRVESLRK